MTIDPVTAHSTYMVHFSTISISSIDHVDDDNVQIIRSEDTKLKPIILAEGSYGGY